MSQREIEGSGNWASEGGSDRVSGQYHELGQPVRILRHS